MSVETEIAALLTGYAPLFALVAKRVALNAVPEGSATPLVVFSVSHEPIELLDGSASDDQCAVSLQCWADNALAADAVADQVVAAFATAPRVRCVAITGRSSTFDPELGLDGTLLTVEWWG